MNNSQFRKLVLDTPARKTESTQRNNGVNTTPSALGSRMRSSIPMTPRSVAGHSSINDFAHQLALQNASLLPPKKFKSKSAPRGAKLPSGYIDRAKQRETQEQAEIEEEESEDMKRVRALEEMMRLGQIDAETYVGLRKEILGEEDFRGEGEGGLGKVAETKGLDWGLLERVRRGEVGVEDVLEGRLGMGKKEEGGEEEGGGEDVDDEFEKLEERDVEAVVREKEKKKGEMAPPSLTGKKRNRDQILAELKAQRAAAKAAAQPALGARFKRVGEQRKPGDSRIERDSKGREVLITIDEDGNEKRKVRKIARVEAVEEKGKGLLMPDKDAKPLGMEVPDLPKPVEEEDDMDIFEGAGNDYDPLAGLDDSDSEEEDKEEGEVADFAESKSDTKPSNPPPTSMQPPPKPPSKPGNYFGSSTTTSLPPIDKSKPAALNDPVFLAALKKASSLTPISTSTSSAEEKEKKAKEERLKKLLERDDRDAEDLDMGFGSSRFEDEKDFEEGGKRDKLSEWGEEDGEEKGRGKGKGEKKERKRGGKKRKGDGENLKDVLGVIEGRKKAGGS